MGTTTHESSLRYKIKRLMRNESLDNESIEDWLVDVANDRGARVVFRATGGVRENRKFPGQEEFSNEELVVALCQLNCADRPQILRLASQLISGMELKLNDLLRLAVMERASRVVKDIAEQALKVDPKHPAWVFLNQSLQKETKLAEPLLHWTRLAEPLFAPHSTKNIGWKLVS